MLFTADTARRDGMPAWPGDAVMYATRLVKSERVLAGRELDSFIRKARHEETPACALDRCWQCADILAIAERVGRVGSVTLHPMHPPVANAQ